MMDVIMFCIGVLVGVFIGLLFGYYVAGKVYEEDIAESERKFYEKYLKELEKYLKEKDEN